MIVPQSEFGIYSTNSSKKSSWWNDCSSTRDRKHPGQVSILYQRQAAWSPNFPQRWRSVPHVPLHLYGRQMRILPIGRKNLNPRPKAAEFFLMSNCLSRIFGTAKWRLAHNSDQEPMLPKSHTPQDNVIVWQICLFISLKIVKTQRLMRSVSNGRNRVKFTQSVRQKQCARAGVRILEFAGVCFGASFLVQNGISEAGMCVFLNWLSVSNSEVSTRLQDKAGPEIRKFPRKLFG